MCSPNMDKLLYCFLISSPATMFALPANILFYLYVKFHPFFVNNLPLTSPACPEFQTQTQAATAVHTDEQKTIKHGPTVQGRASQHPVISRLSPKHRYYDIYLTHGRNERQLTVCTPASD